MDCKTDSLIKFDYNRNEYDEANPLVLPGKGVKTAREVRKVKVAKKVEVAQAKVLSKKKRKELERKIAQKAKKLTRSELWKELESCAPPISESKVSVLPLFNRTKKHVKTREDRSQGGVVKCKSWKNSTVDLMSDTSKSTDEYSTDDEITDEKTEIGNEPTEYTQMSESLSVTEPRVELDCEVVDSAVSQSKPSTEISAKSSQPARFVLVSRTPEVQTFRLTLPIIADEASIMEAINEHDCVIICGATGCGKTTQVPQFLYEAGYTKDGYLIGITEPRRVAAISMSQRVGTELNLSPKQVSYHIRYEKTVAKETEIKFMTDGVLLQEIKQDFELSRYSAIVVDEAHERSIFTDVLLGLISMVLRLRRRRFTEKRLTGDRILPPLKLIIMSATLRVSDFAENRRLFPPAICSSPPPVIHVESRQFPVTCHFAKFTHTDYLKAAFRKVVEIHRNAAAGGILVFLTGQREVVTLCNWLSRAFPAPKPHPQSEVAVSASEPQSKRRRRKSSQALTDESATSSNCPTPEQSVVPNLDSLATKINLDNFDIIPTDEETELGSLRRVHPRQSSCSKRTKREHPDASEGTDSDAESVNLDDIDEDEEILKEIRSSRGQTSDTMPVHALPLYSLLSPERQQLVFVPPPDGHRLIVVATNVAETSLTIPNIRFVVDSGKVKAKVYDPATGASSFQIMWVSQASAEQRAGRAGRVAPGHCYRLYSSQVFCSMQPFATPDILTRPIDEVVLMLKSYLGSTPLSRFPLPTTPSPIAVEAAECRLVALGALEELPQSGSSDIIRSITRAGRWMARLPLPARFARMLLFADQHQLMPYAVILVSVLSVPDVFMTTQSTDLVDTDTNTKKLPSQVPNALEQFRANFAQQFVRRKSDLYFGDLAVLLGTVCCLERYAAQLSGMADPEPSILEFCGGRKQVLRDPEAALRLLTERCGVRWNAYKEVRQLRRQLTDILNANIPGLCLKLDPVLPRPTPDQVQQLRQLFLVGSPCHLATKFDVPVEGLPAKDRKRLRYAYRVPGVHGPVFVDPGSPLARENFPFLAFLELHTSAKPFLRNVCAIDPQWIPFLAPQNYRVEGLVLSDNVDPVSTTSSLTLSAKRTANHESEDEFDRESDADESVSKIESTQCQSFVTPPSPHYDADHDQILTGAKLVEYVGCGLSVDAMEKGNYGFQLPTTVTLVPLNGLAASRALGAHEARMWSVRWFARNLLEGRVCEQLIPWFPSRIKKNLRTSLLTVSWGLVRVEVRKLIAALAGHDIDSRRGLLARWSVDPSYLSNELASWLLNDAVAGFHSQWPLIPIKDTQN